MTHNPLLQASTLPNKSPAFEQIKPAHYLPAIEAGIEEARQNYSAIKENKDAPTFINTIRAMETATELLTQVTSVFYNQLSCVGGDDLHALAGKIGPITSNFSNDIVLDQKLFSRVKAVYESRDDLDITPEEMTLLTKSYKDFVRGGALLDENKKNRLRDIDAKLSTLAPAFMNNAMKSAEAFQLWIDDDNDLAGLPESARLGAQQAAKDKGKDKTSLFTLDYPSYGPFIKYADNRDLREKMWRASTSKAFGDEFDNCENIKSIVSFRDERAKLLDYKNHAEFVLEKRMAKTSKTVWDFLDTLKATYKPAAENDLKALQTFARNEHDLDDLKPWDISYYAEKLKQKLFNFSSEELRAFLPLDTVLNGCFDHFSKLFEVEFKTGEGYEVWHEDVKVFEVYNKADGEFIGTLYGDFHPRTGKNNGAWMTAYRHQGLFDGKVERPITAIVCNFTKPTADKPSLVTHDEVTTLFHEMGHAFHLLLSDVTYQSLSGVSVLWDFVELPSQLQENWCFEKEAMDMFSGHYKTGEKIPTELIDKLRAAKNFMIGWFGLRQVNLGTLDMQWFTRDPATLTDIAAFEDEHTKDTSLFPRLAGPLSTSFSHIFAGGYSAGYYSYKWAAVLDADAFELFLERGLYHAETAADYKTKILSKGGSDHPATLYQNFRGRDADPKALLRRENLLDKAS